MWAGMRYYAPIKKLWLALHGDNARLHHILSLYGIIALLVFNNAFFHTTIAHLTSLL